MQLQHKGVEKSPCRLRMFYGSDTTFRYFLKATANFNMKEESVWLWGQEAWHSFPVKNLPASSSLLISSP